MLLILRLQMARAIKALRNRILNPPPTVRTRSTRVGASAIDQAEAAEWLAAMEAGHLSPPRNVRDAAAWDSYWTSHLRVGLMEQGFSDMMSSDPGLPALLAGRGVRTILCAGNGFSGEAFSLALFGFDVTALDISAVPASAIADAWRQPDHPLHDIPGFTIDDANVVRLSEAGPIAPEHCPPIHADAGSIRQGGGTLSFVTGDLLNADVCPGPFDAVIERRTLQLFPLEERADGLTRLVARLGARGVFVSQQHSGRWRPGDSTTHYAAEWLQSEGFATPLGPESAVAPRLALLKFSTG